MGIFDWFKGKKETPSEPKKEVEKTTSNTKEDKVDGNMNVKVKISISEGYDEIMIVTTTLKNFEEWVKSWGLDINNFKSNDDGVDFENTEYMGSYIDLVIGLKCEEKFVSISKWEVESESSNGPTYGESLYFDFYNCDFPDDIRKKYNISKNGQNIYYIDGSPINNPEIFTDDEEMVEEVISGYILHKYDEINFEELIKNCEPF